MERGQGVVPVFLVSQNASWMALLGVAWELLLRNLQVPVHSSHSQNTFRCLRCLDRTVLILLRLVGWLDGHNSVTETYTCMNAYGVESISNNVAH